MTFKNSLALALMASFLPLSQGFAERLAPLSGWNVAKVGSEDTRAGDYCALSVEYSTALLTLAKNKDLETNIAFEASVFDLEPGKSYDVVLEIGQEYISPFNIKAASNKGFILRLGKDEAFFDALAAENYIGFEVAGQEVELNLSNIENGVQQLDVCLEIAGAVVAEKKNLTVIENSAEEVSVGAPEKKGDIPEFVAYEAGAVEVQEAAEAVVEKTAGDLTKPRDKDIVVEVSEADKVVSLRDRPRRSARDSRDKDAVKETHSRKRYFDTGRYKRAAEVSEDVSVLEARPSKQVADVDRLRRENKALVETLESERAKFEDALTEQVENNKVVELSERVELLSRENDLMRSQLNEGEGDNRFESLTTALAGMQVREKQLLALLTEKEVLISDLKRNEGQEQNSDAQLLIQDLQQKVINASKREKELVSLLEQQRQSMPGDRTKDAKEIAALQEENLRLTNMIVALKNDALRDDLKEDAAALYEKEIASLERQLRLLEGENDDLRYEAANSKSDTADLNGLSIELVRYQRIVGDLEARNQRLQDELDIVQENLAKNALKKARGKPDLEQALRRYQQAEKENRRLGRLLAQERSQHEMEISSLEETLFDPSISNAAQRDRLIELEEQVLVLQQALNQEEAGMSRRIRELEGDLAVAQDERDSLQSQLSDREDSYREKRRARRSQPVASEEVSFADNQPVRTRPSAPSYETRGSNAPVSLVKTRHANMRKHDTRSSAPSTTPVYAAPTDPASKAEGILSKANVPVFSTLQMVSKVSRPGFSVYQWDTDGAYGTAEVTTAMGHQVFDTLSTAYIERTRRRCNGDFDAIPAKASTVNGNIVSYDIACVSGENQNAVASVVFHYDGQHFITFAFESTMDNFAKAMTHRDKVAGVI